MESLRDSSRAAGTGWVERASDHVLLDVNLLGWHWVAGISFKFLCIGIHRHNWHLRSLWSVPWTLDPMSIVYSRVQSILHPWVVYLSRE